MKKSFLIVLTGLLVISFSAKAQIIFTDVDPDMTVDTWDVKQLDLDKDGSLDIDLWFHPWGADAEVVAVSFKDVELLGDMINNEFYPFALEQDSTIANTSAQWQSINGTYVNLSKGGNKGHWIGKTDKYLAYRIKKAGQWYYGWIMLTVEGASLPTGFVLYEYAYQSTVNKEIKAGEKEETTGIKNYSKPDEKPGLIFNNQASALIINSDEKPGILTIYDVLGRSRFIIQNPENYQQPINLSSLEKGYYIAVYKTGNTIQILKIDKL